MQINRVERGDKEFILGAGIGQVFGDARTFALDSETGELHIYGEHKELMIMQPEDVQAFTDFLKMVSLNSTQNLEVVDTQGLPPSHQTPPDTAPQF